MEDDTTGTALFPNLPPARRELAIAAHTKLHVLWSKTEGPDGRSPRYVKKEWQSFEEALFALAAPAAEDPRGTAGSEQFQGELERLRNAAVDPETYQGLAEASGVVEPAPDVDDHPLTLADIHVKFQRTVAAEDTPADELRTVARRLLDEVVRLQNLLGEPIRRKPYPDVKLRCAYPPEGVYVGWERHDTLSGSYHPLGGILLSLNEAVWFARCFIDINHGRDALVKDFQGAMHAELAATIEAAVAPVLARCKGWAAAAAAAASLDLLPPPTMPPGVTVVEGPTLPHEFVMRCPKCADMRVDETCYACKGSHRIYIRAAPEERP